MTKIDTFIDIIKEYEGKELTTKYLIEELGITSYYIGVLTHKGIIDKKTRGIYKVKETTKDTPKANAKKIIMNDANNGKKYSQRGFAKFRDLVLDGHYEKAYDALVECCEMNKDNHEYDNHYRMYFILITAILKLMGKGKKCDYNYDDRLLEFYEAAKTEYYESFLEAREAILAEHYEEAYEKVKIYADKELARYKENKISTVISKQLLEEIVRMLDNKKKTSKMLDQAYMLLKGKKYEDAKKIFEDAELHYNSLNGKKWCGYLRDLCETVIAFENDETLLLPERKVYEFKEDASIASVFATFMKNKEYQNANMYVEKCLSLYKNSFYYMARELLDELIFLNKYHYNKNHNKTETEELRMNTQKSDGEANKHFSRFLWALQHLDFHDAFKEIKISLSYVESTKSLFYNNCHNIYELLKTLIDVEESKLPLAQVNHTYLSSDSDQFNFNYAVRLKDWQAAHKYLSKLDISKSLVLEAYDLIIRAIFRQDKINQGIALTEEDELKPLSCRLKVEVKSKTEEKESEEKSQVTELVEEDKIEEPLTLDGTIDNYEDDSIREVLKSIENLTLNYETLYNLIKAREFEEAFALIKREEEKGYSIEQVKQESIMAEEKTPEESEEISKKDEEICITNQTSEEVAREDDQEQEKTLEPQQLTEKQKHKLEVLEAIKDIELNYDNLYDLVSNRNYEMALYLLEREEKPNEQPSRLYFNARRLISQYLHIVRGTFQEVPQRPLDYTQDCFKIFFAAINNRDYFSAFEYVDECIERAREPEEMHLFKLILEDICGEINRQEEERENKERVKRRIEKIDNRLFELSNKQEFSDDDTYECQSLLQEKSDIYYENGMRFDKDVLLLGVADAAKKALDNGLNDYYFARVLNDKKIVEVDYDEVCYSIGTNSSKVGDIFYDALRCGDVLTVEDIITNENWDNFRDKMNNTNLRLIKKLVVCMRDHMPLMREEDEEKENIIKQHVPQELIDRTDNLAYELLNDEEKKAYEKAALLRKLAPLIKRQKYAEALAEILESDVPLIDEETCVKTNDGEKNTSLLEIAADIVAAKEAVKIESHRLFDEFNVAMEGKNIDEARKKLIEYSGFIVSKSIDRDLANHRRRIDILEKDLKQDNYEAKERIYEEALAMYYKKGQYNHYQKAIGILNRYIELDNGINCKGYLLRARAYHKIKQFKEAKQDYEMTLQISPEPIAYRALGTFAYEEGDYERAIGYLEKFQAIRPFKDEDVSRMLATCYNSTGKEEKAIPYNRHLKHLSYLKRK